VLVAALNDARAASAYRGNLGTITALRLRPLNVSIMDVDEPIALALLLGLLAGVPLVVLGIACANVAGIQLAKAIGRTHELAVRTALGASRLRIARLLAFETALAATAAAVVAWTAGRALLTWSAAVLPIAPRADRRLLFFAAGLPIAVTFAAGLLPAWRATGLDVLAGLRSGARVGRAASARLRRGVVAAQVTLSVALLLIAAALAAGLFNLPDSVGPLHDDVLTAEVAFADLAFDEHRQREARTIIVSRVRAIPGVESVALSPSRLFRSSGGDGNCWPGSGPRPANLGDLSRIVTPEFFEILRIPLRAGRTFQPGEDADAVIVNDSFRRGLPNPQAPLGAAVSVGRGQVARVIGVVADSYERYPTGAAEPRCYLPWDEARAGAFAMFIRTHQPDATAPLIRRALREIDPRLAPTEIGTVADLARVYYRDLLAVTNALLVAGTIAISLAAIGLFGVLSYGAAERTREFGIRLALGGRPADIRRAIVGESLLVVGLGASAGILMAGGPIVWLMSQGLRTLSLSDPWLWLTVTAVLLLVTLGALARPLRSVSRLNPLIALRET
jgi:predicted permease